MLPISKVVESLVNAIWVQQYQNSERKDTPLSSPKKPSSQTEVPKHMYRRLMSMYGAGRTFKEIRDSVQHAFVDGHITLEEYDEMMEPSMIRSFISIDRQY